MTVEYTDSELISACRRDVATAWNTLVDRYRRLVYSIPLRAGLSHDDAADVFQTTFTQLFQHLRTIREPEKLAGWLITTAKRESWNTSRKRRRELAEEDIDALQAADEAQQDHPNEDQWADQALLAQALEQIGQPCNDLLRLLYYDKNEPSYDEIGRRLGMPLGSIGPTRARCLGKLRKIVQAMGLR